MSDEHINADFSERIVIRTGELPWIPSPQAGVERRMLDRIGGEVARATSLVRYAANSAFPEHSHAKGEEFLVLDGVFSDEHGDYPAGTYIRNPPGSRHSPGSAPGCTILVKLRQMPASEERRVVRDIHAGEWTACEAAGHWRHDLFADESTGETVGIERLDPGARLAPYVSTGGEELFVLSGECSDEYGFYPAGTWVRNPPGSHHSLHSAGGALFWVKRGHLSRPGA
jgi:anti-sigma factor ChrR (cupin superfamily)